MGYERAVRRSGRLPTWDYGDTGAYFVTICTHDRRLLFGCCAGDDLVLNQFGKIVEEVWRKTIGDSPGEFVVMPNHVHGIIWLQRDAPVPANPPLRVEQLRRLSQVLRSLAERNSEPGKAVAQPLRREDIPIRLGLRDGLHPGSVIVLVRTFKAAAAKRINTLRRSPGAPVWQRNYYDRIIRSEHELKAAREYILDNPRKWAEDKHNPSIPILAPSLGRAREEPPLLGHANRM